MTINNYQLPVAWLLSAQPLAQSYPFDLVVSLASDGSDHNIPFQTRSKDEHNYKHAGQGAKQYIPMMLTETSAKWKTLISNCLHAGSSGEYAGAKTASTQALCIGHVTF